MGIIGSVPERKRPEIVLDHRDILGLDLAPLTEKLAFTGSLGQDAIDDHTIYRVIEQAQITHRSFRLAHDHFFRLKDNPVTAYRRVTQGSAQVGCRCV